MDRRRPAVFFTWKRFGIYVYICYIRICIYLVSVIHSFVSFATSLYLHLFRLFRPLEIPVWRSVLLYYISQFRTPLRLRLLTEFALTFEVPPPPVAAGNYKITKLRANSRRVSLNFPLFFFFFFFSFFWKILKRGRSFEGETVLWKECVKGTMIAPLTPEVS